MPPLDWAIIQSLLVTLILPSCAVALGILGIVIMTTRCETRRSIATSIALVGAMAAGNLQGQLVPILAIEPVIEQTDDDQSHVGSSQPFPWRFETGWYSLFSVSVIAAVAELVIDWRLRKKIRPAMALAIGLAAAIGISIWMTPFEISSIKPWSIGLMACVLLANATTLRRVGEMRFGYTVPLILAVIWGGSATGVAVLAHSARFADLAILLSNSLLVVGLLVFMTKQRHMSLFAVPSTFIPGLMTGAALNTYSEIPLASFVLISIAPAFLLLVHLSSVRTWAESRPITTLVVFTIPCMVAVGLAIQAEI